MTISTQNIYYTPVCAFHHNLSLLSFIVFIALLFAGVGENISYILQGEIEAFFPRGGCNSQGCVFPEPKAREIRIRGSWHPPRGKIFNFSQEFVILLPPNSAESQNFRGF